MKRAYKTIALLTATLLLMSACAAPAATPPEPTAEPTGVFSPNPYYEYLVGSAVWQLSAESQALMLQAFSLARAKVASMEADCLDPGVPDWEYRTGENGEKLMYYSGKRVAIVSDIDDTLVDGVHYTANIVGKNGDMNNAAFARFVKSEGCTALPGAVDFVNYCIDCGIEFYYITNRYDQGYRIDQSDDFGSYAQAVGDSKGLYVKPDGTEIGATIYQVMGESFYDISLESMERLGFPVDDQHLILNDGKLRGDSKEPARTAVRDGAEAYPNGQREDGNATGSALTAAMEPHHIAMLLGDNLADFTDAFSTEGLDAVSRAKLAAEYADKFGTEWIMLPNAVYGSSMNYASSYGIPELLEHYDYTNSN